MEGCAAVGGTLDGAGERVDALAALEVVVWGDALHNDDAPLHAQECLGDKHDLTALVAHAHAVAISNTEVCQVVRVHFDAWAAVARLARGHFIERRVEIVTRWAGSEA